MPLQPLLFSPLPDRPLVSVLIANYNYERYVGRALESLQSQTWSHWEAIVCDDGSSDRSSDVIANYAARDRRILLLRRSNGGMAAALNDAAAAARGDLVALLDSDDEYLPGRIATVIDRFRRHPEAGTVSHPLCAVSGDSEVIKPRHPRILAEGWLAPGMLAGMEPALPPCSGLTFRREVAERVFPLPVRFRRCADKVAQDRAALAAPVSAIPQPLALYRLHGANLTGLSGPVTPEALSANLEFLEQLWKDRIGFIRAWHGVEADPRPWREIESAHFFLAARLLGVPCSCSVSASSIPGRVKRILWRALLALPRPLGAAGLRFWWTEHLLKRNVRLVWDFICEPPVCRMEVRG